MPLVENRSLWTIGIPVNEPCFFLEISSSASFAFFKAFSSFIEIKEFNFESNLLILFKK